ncbi:zinc finger protein 425-like isoform X1 [Haliotis asinina]|uniref:zinc finger protein 425-like isoform X1 n=1 Tax=Haliotis asinina TaxID=109174 RepID=UPI00353206D6
MFIETLEFTIPVDLCDLFSTLKRGPRSNLEFPASVNSYGTTQDASVQVVLRSNKLTFKVDGVSSEASIISKSESKTLKLSVFDVDRTLMPQENDDYISSNMTISEIQHSTPVSNQFKRHHEVSVTQPTAKSRRTSFSESPRPKSPVHRRVHHNPSSCQSPSIQSKSQNDTPVNVKQEPEDPDLIEIEPDDVVPKKETPYMQIDYSSDVPHTQTSQAALDRLSHPQSSHSQSPGSSSSSFHQNVPHVPDYSEPSTSQARYGDQSADDFLVFQDENDDGDDNEADYSNDEFFQAWASQDGSWTRGHNSYSNIRNVSQAFGTRINPSITLSAGLGNKLACIFADCAELFEVEEDLRSHLILHRNDESHVCPTCYLQYILKENLVKHIESGSCQKTFRQFVERKKNTQCEECGKYFATKQKKEEHLNSQHRGITYACSCGLTYAYKTGLDRHKKSSGHIDNIEKQ